MKKILKLTLITLASLVLIVALAAGTAVYYVFTPEKLTPIVRKQAGNYLTCKTEIGEVELTFFSTFPNFSLRANRVTLVNPMPGSANDTLFNAKAITAAIDFEAYWKRNEVILTELTITNASANIYTDSLGRTNYDIMAPDTTATQSGDPLGNIDLKNIELDHVDLTYNDDALKFNTAAKGLIAQLSGTLVDDNFNSHLKISQSTVWLAYEGEKYLQGAAIELDMPSEFSLSKLLVNFKEATATVNGLPIKVNGTFDMDSAYENFDVNLAYQLEGWSIKKALTLTPPSYTSYLKGVDMNGTLSSHGKIKGLYNDSLMPLMDISLTLADGTLKYDSFQLPLSQMNGKMAFYSDLATDSISYFRIDHFEAKTPQSSFSTSGTIDHLFSDIRCNLSSDADILLAEMNPIIPANMKTKVAGRAVGKVKSDFTLLQIEKMQLEKMKLSGTITIDNLDAQYDSISLKTGRTSIEFAIPNTKATNKNARFVIAKLDTDRLETSKIKSYNATLDNASLQLEASDVRDTTKIPHVKIAFKMASLVAAMDTMSLSAANPSGKMVVAPRKGHPDQPLIQLAYQGNKLQSAMGKESIVVEKLNFDANIENDNSQKDIFLQWLTSGFIDMDGGVVRLSALQYPIEIPSIQMEFNPEQFNIKESSMKIDKSDFRLTGRLNNLLSYVRKDSLLRGDFTFTSNNTDIAQLMALTNGMGSEETDTVTPTGPYMVPKGIDVKLHTNIKKATIGSDTITNINGSLQVKDGVLALNELRLTTPATRIQLTAVYRSPRKNHLYMGIDYHMLDIEIDKLLAMIPDIDTIMPMLKSFKGTGEFHIATETYLDSLYNPKISTIRGAASIKGHNLVLMDSKEFSEISKKLNFNKKTENKIDSLFTEFTIFKNEVDVYPFLIVMDKYKAIIAGRHRLDMKFDYNVSLIDSPLPVALGLDIDGDIEVLKYSLAKCMYDKYFRPTSRHVVKAKRDEIRKIMKQMLVDKVVTEDIK